MGFLVCRLIDYSYRHHGVEDDLLDNAGMSIYHGECKNTSSFCVPPALGCRCSSFGHPLSIVPEVQTWVSGRTVLCWCSRQKLCLGFPCFSVCGVRFVELLSRPFDLLICFGPALGFVEQLVACVGLLDLLQQNKKKRATKQDTQHNAIPRRTYRHRRTHTQKHSGTL